MLHFVCIFVRSVKLGCGISKTPSTVNLRWNDSISIIDKMESKGSEHLSPTSSCHQKNGSGKEHIAGKVALKPGHSLMDWIRLSRSAQDLANVGGQMLTVTMPELKQHNAHDDAWTAIRGE